MALVATVSVAQQHDDLLSWLDLFEIPGDLHIDDEDVLYVTGTGDLGHDLAYLIAALDQIENVFDIDLDIDGLIMIYGKRRVELHDFELYELIDAAPRDRSAEIQELL